MPETALGEAFTVAGITPNIIAKGAKTMTATDTTTTASTDATASTAKGAKTMTASAPTSYRKKVEACIQEVTSLINRTKKTHTEIKRGIADRDFPEEAKHVLRKVSGLENLDEIVNLDSCKKIQDSCSNVLDALGSIVDGVFVDEEGNKHPEEWLIQMLEAEYQKLLDIKDLGIESFKEADEALKSASKIFRQLSSKSASNRPKSRPASSLTSSNLSEITATLASLTEKISALEDKIQVTPTSVDTDEIRKTLEESVDKKLADFKKSQQTQVQAAPQAMGGLFDSEGKSPVGSIAVKLEFHSNGVLKYSEVNTSYELDEIGVTGIGLDGDNMISLSVSGVPLGLVAALYEKTSFNLQTRSIELVGVVFWRKETLPSFPNRLGSMRLTSIRRLSSMAKRDPTGFMNITLDHDPAPLLEHDQGAPQQLSHQQKPSWWRFGR